MVAAIVGISVLCLLLLLFIYLFRNCECIYNILKSTYDSFVWSGIIQTILQSYLVITFMLANAIATYDTMYMGALGFLILFMPAYTTGFLYYHRDNLTDRELRDKYGAFFQMLRLGHQAPF